METEHLNHECSTLPNLAINPGRTNELTFDSDITSNTKQILENVCNDFESIDVLSSKENRFVSKKWKPPGSFSEYPNDGSDFTDVTVESRNIECAPTESVFISNTASSQTESIQSSVTDESTLNPQITTAILGPAVDSQNQTSSDIVNSVNSLRTEMVPLQDPSKVGILSDNFTNDKNLSASLAELADAEIVETSENGVSIIISNPRFIQVLNCKDSGLPTDTSDITLDSNCIVSEKENFNEVIVDGSASVSDYSLLEDNVQNVSHTEVANEITYPGEEMYNFTSSTPNTLQSKEKNRPYFRSRADLGKVAAARARRITAKMKTDWTRILEEKGVLVCPLSGCLQRYRTMANFMTHYKYCYSGMEKDLKHCPHCASVIFSSYTAVLHHMKVEHPEKLEEYKTNFPEPENAYDCFEDENSTRFVEISQKTLTNHKRKFNIAKENRLSPKKRLLKHKLKSINQPVIENSQLRECGRFDEIVSKISSVNKTQSTEKDENKLNKERRKRKLILTGHVVAAEKYFEDERDFDVDGGAIDFPMEAETEEKEKFNTKSRLVLNMDRYKRYTEYLSVTRDFGSHRKTYSRPKSSNILDSTQQTNVCNDSSELDIHQLNSSLESSTISLNENDSLCLSNNNPDLCCVSPEISAFDPLQSEAKILNKIHLDSNTKRNSIMNYKTKREVDRPKYNGPNGPTKEKIPCYKPQISTLISPKSEPIPSRKPSMKISPIITYGKIPDSISAPKSDRLPTVDFDSLVKNSANIKKINSTARMQLAAVEKSKYNKEDGIKHPHNGNSSIPPFKRKRGRPRKDASVEARPPLSKISENSHAHTHLKSLKKSGNLKRVKENKTFSKNSKKNAKNSKAAMTRISSKMHSKLLQKRRMKISAKSSLKKAIMCGVKRNRKGEKKRGRGRPPRVCIRSLLKNAKVAGRQKNRQSMYLTPLQNSNTDHNYFSSLRICEKNQDNSLNNSLCVRGEKPSETLDTIAEKENNCSILLHSLKEVEFSEISPEEVIISSTGVCVPEKEVTLSVPAPIESVEIVSVLPNEKNSKSSLNEQEENIAQSKNAPNSSKGPTLSSDLKTVSDLSVSSHPTNDDKVVSNENTSPTIIKRSRGRPRKNATPQQTKKPDEETPKMCKLVDQVSTPAVSGVRKSLRVKRKRELGSDEVESVSPDTHRQEMDKEKTLTRSNELVEKTGRRGRPRKYPRRDDNSNSEPKNTDMCETKILQKQPDGPSDKEQLQVTTPDICIATRSRRSRARQEQLEPEVKEDMAQVGRNIPEKAKQQGEEPSVAKLDDKIIESKDEGNKDKSISKKDAQILAHADSCSPSEKQLILPIKKRKKIDEKINSMSSSNICDILVQKEMTPKIKGTSDNLEKDACSKMNEKEIPALLCSTSIQVENVFSDKDPGLDKLCITSTEIEREMYASVCFGEIYPTLKPDIDEYKLFSNKQMWKECLEASVSIKLKSTSNWIKLKCFDSVVADDSKSSMFFTGGPVQSSAFCPVPSHMDQYIAVASSDIMYTRKKVEKQNSLSYANTKNDKGLIQFWNLGSLQSTRINQLPSMEFALEHQHGIITQMKWCPKSCYDLPLASDGVVGSRLGLLAISCSDSYVRVYSVPHPNILPKTCGNEKSIYNTRPSLVLTPLFSETCTLTRRSIATCIDWHRNAEVIAAGYGNGCICVWMIKIILAPSATIVTVKNKERSLSILPYLVFDASGTPVTSISFAPLDNCQYLVSSSFDKTLRFFDLHDTSMPFCSIKRGFPINDCKWAKSFCGSLVSLHDGLNFKGSSFVKECGTEEFPAQNIASPVGSLTCSTISNIIDMQAIADSTGTVSVNFFHCSSDQIKQPYFDTHVIFETDIVILDEHERLSLYKALNSEVSAVLNDAMDIVEVVMDEFSNCCDYNSTDNLHELVTSNIVKVKEICYYEPELKDIMNCLLESVSEKIDISKINMEDAPVVPNLQSRRLDRTDETQEITYNSAILSSGDLKENRHFPIKEMLTNSLEIQTRQLDYVISDSKKFKISSELSIQALCPTNELINIHNSVSKDSLSDFSVEGVSDTFPSNLVPKVSSDKKYVDSDCSEVLNHCVEIVCDVMLHLCTELEHNSLFNESVESKLDCSTVPEKSVRSKYNDVPLQSTKSECHAIHDSIKSRSNNVIQKSEADSSDISNHGGESNFSDDDLSMISECTSDSCDSIPSFLSDSLAPATPSVSPIPIYEEEFSPVAAVSSVENKVASSEPNCISTEVENCSSELAKGETASKNESSKVNMEELQCNKMHELANCISNGESNLNHTHALDPKQNLDSSSNPECLLEEPNNDFVVPNCNILLSDSDQNIQTINGESPPTIEANDNTHKILESVTRVEELVCPDILCKLQCPQTSMQSVENINSSEGTCNSVSACDLEEGTKEYLLKESPVSYASLISTCGLVFKDVNTNNSSSDERKDSLDIESNVLASVNAISWNPNYGCHFWLVAAGNSGVARLVCVSELSPQENTS